MIQTPRIDYRIRDDATPHVEINALANVYRFVLDRHARKEAVPENRPEDVKGRSENDFHASNHSNP